MGGEEGMIDLPDYDITGVLYEDTIARTYRAANRSRAVDVILRTSAATHPGPRQLARLRREYELLVELECDGVDCHPILIESQDSLLLEIADSGGVPIKEFVGNPRCGPELFFEIALALTDSVACLHDNGVIVGEITSESVLFNVHNGTIQLSYLGRASRLSRRYPKYSGVGRIEGSLPYLSPEQTGLMNRVVDYRSDFYAIGVVLYELASGALPFDASDALEWVHSHVARDPKLLAVRVAGLPPMVRTIIAKLLSKLAEDRYRSISGLQDDLRRCRAQLRSGSFKDFEPGAGDLSPALTLPQKLYGREPQVTQLRSTFRRVAASGTPELVLVTGYPGVGKSVLVDELHQPTTADNGYFVSGKFDQYRRDLPYRGVLDALAILIQQILGESEERLAAWRRVLTEALGGAGRLLTDLIPRLELVIGPQPPVVDLPADRAAHRTRSVFVGFVGAFATAEHPLVLFLDDLQWADEASLEMIDLLSSADNVHLLLVGAYRSNEVGTAHPLSAVLGALARRPRPVTAIDLLPLTSEHVEQLLADALGCSRSAVRQLAEVVCVKTQGNPFFCLQFISALHEDGLLVFDRLARGWRWDLGEIEQRAFTDNVVEFMGVELRRLPERTQRALQIAGFIGNTFDLETLSVIQQQRASLTEAELWPALRMGLVITHDDESYRFLHDRVQEAAYAMTPVGQRANMHLRIGRLLRDRTSPAELDERLFEIVNHLDQGSTEMTDRGERLDLAGLDQRAGDRALRATVYPSAATYYAHGVSLLPADSWTREYRLTYELYLSAAQSEYLCGRFEMADGLLDELLAATPAPVDRARAHLIRLELQLTSGDSASACAVAQTSLAELGVHLPERPTPPEVERAYEDIQSLLSGRSIDSLLDLPEIIDPAMEMAVRVLTSTSSTTAAFFTDRNLWAFQDTQMIDLCLRHGNGDDAVIAYVLYGFMLGAHLNRYAEGYRYTELAHELMLQRGALRHRGSLLYHQALAALWVLPTTAGITAMEEAMVPLMEEGNLVNACLSRRFIALYALLRGDALPVVADLVERGRAFAQESHYPDVVALGRSTALLVARLRGVDADSPSFENSGRPQAGPATVADRIPFVVVAEHVSDLMWHTIIGQFDEAQRSVDAAEPLMWSIPGLLPNFDYFFYGSITLAERYPTMPTAQQTRAMAMLRANLDQLRIWAESNAEAFAAAHLIVCAEMQRIEDRPLEAMRLYDLAIVEARRASMAHLEGIAHERAGLCHLDQALQSSAHAHLRAAHRAYRGWGALAKLEALELAFPGLWFEPDRLDRSVPGASPEEFGANIDAIAISKAAQAISSEVEQDALQQTLLRIALEQAGAQQAVLLLSNDGGFSPVASARVTGQSVTVSSHRIADEQAPGPDAGSVAAPTLPDSILTYVRRSGESVTLDNPVDGSMFGGDPYLRRHRPASVLCLPILRQGTLIGLLYLEHRTVTRVFSSARLVVLQQLATQAAISLENAQLYRRLEAEGRRYRALYDENPSIYFTVDGDAEILLVNEFGASQLGYRAADLVGTRYVDLYDDRDRERGEQLLLGALTGDEGLLRWELRKRTGDGEVVWMRESVRPVARLDGSRLLLVVCENTSESWRLSEELNYQATHDHLTGLWNRREFERRLERLLDDEGGNALIYFDLDQFKLVNDTAGHLAGDEMLRQLAARMAASLGDHDVIARVGGDEFAVLLEQVSDGDARDVCDGLLATVRGFRFVWEGRHFPISASLGLVRINAANRTVRALLSAADTAAYLAKENGGNRVHVYDETDEAAAARIGRLEWVLRINDAMAEERFFLVFQTIVPLQAGALGREHLEILLRMRDRDGSVIPPGVFLPVAERHQLSGLLDYWVVEQTLTWLAAVPARLERIDVCSINLSGRSIGDAEFADRLSVLLGRTPVPMDRLCFEVTETAAITHLDTALVFMNALRARGCRFALDDFGSGLASFSYLKVLPLDYVKIDGQFVKDMLRNDFSLALVRSICEVARAGGLETIAEFAESADIIDALRLIGADYAQGYGISHPVPLDQF